MHSIKGGHDRPLRTRTPGSSSSPPHRPPVHSCRVPTVLRVRGYRFHFWSNEGREPPHIHVSAADNTAKVWLSTLELAQAVGYDSPELREILELVRSHRDELLRAWNEYFGS